MTEEERMKKRFVELAEKSYQSNLYTFTTFLNEMEINLFYQSTHEFSHVPYTLFGGMEECERQMVRFGAEEALGYEEAFPITCLKIQPLIQKFADELTHRDILGALMNLGIKRETLGDITVKKNVGYVFCNDKIADFIVKDLTKVKHTNVVCTRLSEIPADWSVQVEELKIQAESERIDGIISKVFRLSRTESLELFRTKKIFINGQLCENNSRCLKANDTVSVRGYGKFLYDGAMSVSKKGKKNIVVRKYVR